MYKHLIKIIIFIIVSLSVLFFYHSISQPLSCETNCNFTITKGENLRNIANRLEVENFISSSMIFQIYFKLKGGERDIKAGDYCFDLPVSIKDVYNIITSKQSAQNNHFLITEGETLLEIEENLKEKGLIDKDSSLKKWQLRDFFDLLGINESQPINFGIFSKMSPDVSLEGFLYPDSYHLPQGLTEKEILSIFIKNFVSKIYHDLSQTIETNLALSINGKTRSFYDILRMASLLEKEVPCPEEKQMVADLLWRRLDDEFLLQVDATICYAQYESFKKCSLNRDLFKLDSHYNTYLYKGLPPTPINNPGIESLEAALQPISNNYWYYLTDKKTGDTIFSENYDDHLEARAKYF